MNTQFREYPAELVFIGATERPSLRHMCAFLMAENGQGRGLRFALQAARSTPPQRRPPQSRFGPGCGVAIYATPADLVTEVSPRTDSCDVDPRRRGPDGSAAPHLRLPTSRSR